MVKISEGILGRPTQEKEKVSRDTQHVDDQASNESTLVGRSHLLITRHMFLT